MRWHYSRRMPVGKLVRVGAWEDGKFIGVVIFARGNSPSLGDRFGCKQDEVVELVRVALDKHSAPVSKIVAIALRFLRKACPGIRLVVSFADPARGHHGGIYQAGGWTYCGTTSVTKEFWSDGRWKHNREISGGAFGQEKKVKSTVGLKTRTQPAKHRYVMPFDVEMKKIVSAMSQPYPKRSACVPMGESAAPPQTDVRIDPHAPLS